MIPRVSFQEPGPISDGQIGHNLSSVPAEHREVIIPEFIACDAEHIDGSQHVFKVLELNLTPAI